MPEHRLQRTRAAYGETILTAEEQERSVQAFADAFWAAMQNPVIVTDEGFTANVIEGEKH